MHPYELIRRNADSIAPKKKMMDYLVTHHAMKWTAYWAVDAGMKRDSVELLIEAAHSEVNKALRAEITEKFVSYDERVAELKTAPLHAKQKLANAIAIIPVSASSAFLGTPEKRLHELKKKSLFGDVYMGRQCFSKDELTLLAQNAGWLERYTPVASSEVIVLPHSSSLDDMTFVDEDFAVAYTDLNIRDLMKQVKPSKFCYGTYGMKSKLRLSDLEKIRIAKLNGQQQ